MVRASETENSEQLNKLKKIDAQARSLMEETLADYPESIQKKVRGIVKISGISEKDPLFLILLICRITHVLIEDAPELIRDSFDNGRVSLIRELETERNKFVTAQNRSIEKHQQAAVDVSVARLTKILERELSQRGIPSRRKISPKLLGVISTSAVGIVCLLMGFAGGWSFEAAALGKDNLTRLSAEDRVALNWLKSREGQLAKNILSWNEDLADKSCKNKVKDLNVTIQIGASKAISGYCWVWVEAPNKRRFE